MLWNGKVPPKVLSVSDIPEEEVTWMWWPYVPNGYATMIVGPGGSGKSHITVDIAARLSTGSPFPGEDTAEAPKKVLMLSSEDEVATVLRPRLRKAGANLDNIKVPPMFFTLDQKGLELVDYYIQDVDAGIVFIDPVVAYVGSKVDLNKANEVRPFAGGLGELAKKHKVPILFVHHTRKGSEGQDYEKALGSIDFNNAARSVLYTTTAPNGDRIMRHVKANYAALGPTWGYRFGSKGFEWTGFYQEDGTRSTTRAARRNEAADWLREFLLRGPRRSVDIETEANKLGFNHRTLVRAKEGLAESVLVHQNGTGKWYWKLKETSNANEIPNVAVKRHTEGLGRESSRDNTGTSTRISQSNEAMDQGRQGQDDIEDLMDRVLGHD